MANSETPKTIILQLNERFSERPLDEARVKASNSITPGMLIAFDGSDVIPPAAGPTFSMVAVENPYLTPTYGGTRAADTDYGNGDPEPCRYFIPQRGDVAYCLLDAGENVGRGDLLVVSATTDGTLAGAGTIDATTVAGTLIARAEEAVDNSGGGEAVRIRARFL